mmetsp:Transcript_107805/g.315168  ORF Transcript_107805/g.315168 Transcript_107805/m.315168 type:complete len:212 (+) Transcript_107805:55-690(+)
MSEADGVPAAAPPVSERPAVAAQGAVPAALLAAELARRVGEWCAPEAFALLRAAAASLARLLPMELLVLQIRAAEARGPRPGGGEQLVEWMVRQEHVGGGSAFAACARSSREALDAPMQDWEALTPLMVCAMRNWVSAARALLWWRADVAASDWRGMQPLHFAAAAGRSDVCSLLLEARADPSAQGNHVIRHQTPAQLASAECAALLRQHS